MRTRKIYFKIIIGVLLSGMVLPSCKDFLDVVPDNIPTVDHAFNKRYQAEGFLYGCYSFLPDHSHPENNPAFLAGDEAWVIDNIDYFDPRMANIAKGFQGTNLPIGNYWASNQDAYELRGGKALFTGIRDCNIFLENIHKAIDLDDWEREQWIAEAKFLKAYFHFWLFRMYGPIPVIDENIPISAGEGEVQRYRAPVDSVVNYIAGLLDEASVDLPLKIFDITNELGRITKPIALSLKAQVLTYAASPQFNGNSDYAGMVDDRGISLFPQTYDPEKWGRAAEALEEAIAVCHDAGHQLYDFASSGLTITLDEKTIQAMQVRGAFSERWNDEIIWCDPNSDPYYLQRFSWPQLNEITRQEYLVYGNSPTLRVVEQFYTKNGVPIEEDTEWTGVDLYGLRTGDEEHKYYIQEGFETLNLHFDREARFYGAISFDGGTFYGNGNIEDENMKITQFKLGSIGQFLINNHTATGYLVKKVCHRLTAISNTADRPTYYRYGFPVIRLADLYLMYAEALNEYKASPDAEVYEYIDRVRDRTGLDGVVESWSNHSLMPDKPLSKEGMRDIIRRERMNELAFEGVRFWDLRRWKLLEEHMNQPIRGLNVLGETTETFYQVQEIATPAFEKKDYLWPIRQGNLLTNEKLIQNSGW